MEYGAKVPQNQRQRYLDRIIDEYLRICPTEKEAFEKVTVPLRQQSAQMLLLGKIVFLLDINLLRVLRFILFSKC